MLPVDDWDVGGTPGCVPTNVEAMAQDAVAFIAFIRALGLDHVDLIGFSLGGFVPKVLDFLKCD